MKTILCYGDSLTFGADPETGGRHPFEDRWPNALAAGLGAGKSHIIAEGLGGRTTVYDDWYTDADRNGARILPTLLGSHSPLDAIIIMLGTNDLKPHLGRTAAEAGRGMGRLVEIVRGHYAQNREPEPLVVLMAPPPIIFSDNQDMMGHFGGTAVIAESENFAAEYKKRADLYDAHFFDAGTVASAHPADGVHLDAKNTRAIGEGLVPLMRKLLSL